MQIQQTHQIDEYVLSRQLATFGFEAQEKLMQMRVFLHGGTALGIGIAKNLVLMSLKEIIIFDNNIITMKDVGRNFACREQHIGKLTRAEVGVGYLQELNANCQVQATQNDNIDFISSNYDCVVVVDNYNKVYLQQLNEKCREKNVGFILSGCLGLYGYTFVDFGPSHTVHDETGEQLNDMIILNITQSQHGVVQLLQQSSNQLNNGDVVEFKEVQGMIELNGKQFTVKVINPCKFEIGDTRGFTAYQRRGKAKIVKIPFKLQFKSFQESLIGKQTLNKSTIDANNTSHGDYPQQLHFILNGVYDFYAKYNRLPKVLDEKEAQELLLLMRQKRLGFLKIDQQMARKVSMYADTQISPVCSFWGGIAAQQVVKFTGKYTPIHQWMHHQFFDALPQNQNISRTLLTENNRYNDYIALFGDDFFNKLKQLNLLVVGAGSVGGECLKTMSLMGVGTGEKGKITVVDDQNVKKFNLSSHMLLTNKNIGFNKAQCVTKAVNELNPSVNFNSQPLKLETQNEMIFTDEFWQGQDLVINTATDSSTSLYIDDQCVWYEKPLIQGRMDGAKCQSLISIPHLTQSIMDTPYDAIEEKDYLRIRAYPITALQTIQWAISIKFSKLYQQLSSKLHKLYVQTERFEKDYYISIEKRQFDIDKKLQKIKKLYLVNESKYYQSCVELMVEEFRECFVESLARILEIFKRDMEQNHTEEIRKRWRPMPKVLELSVIDPLHLQFIQAGANIYAQMINIPIELKSEEVKRIVIKVIEKSHSTVRNQQSQQLTEEQKIPLYRRLLNELHQLNLPLQNAPSVIKLDLQSPTNWHFEFIEAASLLRSRNFNIQPLDSLSIRVLAGKFKPKIVTTTSIVAGILGIQMIKYLLHKPINTHKNATINLAFPTIQLNCPKQPIVNKDEEYDVAVMGPSIVVPGEFTKWQKIEIQQSMILCQLKKFLQQTYNVQIKTIVYDRYTVYNYWNKLETHRRLSMRVQDAVSQKIKEKLWRMKKVLRLQVCAQKDGIDCNMPDIRYHIVSKPKQ